MFHTKGELKFELSQQEDHEICIITFMMSQLIKPQFAKVYNVVPGFKLQTSGLAIQKLYKLSYVTIHLVNLIGIDAITQRTYRPYI